MRTKTLRSCPRFVSCLIFGKVGKIDMTLDELREKANELPQTPGVYRMKDKNGKILYVGKSKSLKNRVSQYFQNTLSHNEKTKKMVAKVDSFDVMLTDTEMEALTLENRLIKLYMPKYNILLKDSKGYPYIKLDMREPYPKLSLAYRRESDGAKYFGPYSGSRTVYRIIGTVQRSFGIASCQRDFTKKPTRPCLYKQMGQCVAPCTGEVSPEAYRELFREVPKFLRGSFSQVREALTEKMQYASENLMFEAAAVYRDRLKALESLWQKQKIVGDPSLEQDVFALYVGDLCSCLAVFYIREGAVMDKETFVFSGDSIADMDGIVSFLADFYTKSEYAPKEILLDFDLDEENCESLTAYIEKVCQSRTKIRIPKRGDRKALCTMVLENAERAALDYCKNLEKDNKILVKLASLLSLEVVPERIEAYDISNLGAEHITCGMIVCDKTSFRKSDYRRFHIEGNGYPDDYASMREALSRRLAYLNKEANGKGGFYAMPDLILLDGGRTHVGAVKQVMESMGFSIPVFGMVKDEYHKTRALCDEDREISIAAEPAVFSFLYRIQEEVHRFSIEGMRKRKKASLTKSVLEEIEGIGPAKARNLLAAFRSFSELKKADASAFAAVKGITAQDAARLEAYFKTNP